MRLSRSWNPDPVCPSVEVLKPRSQIECRGLETQIPCVRLSRSWNPYPKLRYLIDSRTAKVWKSVPLNSRAQKLFRTSITHFYFFTYWVSSPKSQCLGFKLLTGVPTVKKSNDKKKPDAEQATPKCVNCGNKY